MAFLPSVDYIHQICKIDSILFFAVVFYAGSSVFPDFRWHTGFLKEFPAGLVEATNLLLQGLVERCVLLPAITYADESGWTKALRFRPLPGTRTSRDALLEDATQLPSPLLQNKNALLFTLAIIIPGDWLRGGGEDALQGMGVGTYYVTAKGICLSVVLGLVVLDLILGTAHMLSHTRRFKCVLWKHHARHHTQHFNYAAVKFHGEPYDFEVFLTQVCYAFLPRILGMDLVTGMIMINWFSLQLVLEHTGYSCFYLAQLHEAHHRYGSVGFYHFPLWEMLLGRLPTAEQVTAMSNKKIIIVPPGMPGGIRQP